MPVFISEVLDISGGDGTLGVGYIGLGNRTSWLTILGGTAASLTGTIDQVSSANLLDTGIVRITGLRLNEVITPTSEKRFLEIEADIAFPTAEGYDIYGPVRLAKTTGGLDVSAGHARAITEALEAVTTKLIVERFNGVRSATIPAEDLNKAIVRHPIATANIRELPDGVYNSYMDFRAAQPDTSLSVPFEYTRKYHEAQSLTYYRAIADRPKEVKAKELLEFWGIQKEGRAYMQINRNFFELQRLPDGTLTVALPSDLFDASVGAGAIVGAVGFGLVGGLIGSLLDEAASGNQPPNVYHFDLATGILNDPDAQRPAGNEINGIILESYGLNPAAAPITITTKDGRRIATLAPEQYAIIPRDQEVCFAVPGSEPYCLVLETSPENPQAFYRIITNKKGKFRFTWMADELAAAIYAQAKDGTLLLKTATL